MTLLAILVTCALLMMLTIASGNYRAFPRLAAVQPAPSPRPAVSVLIPARNEAANIASTVCNLLAQSYAGDYEVLVLDDHSSDGTARLARIAAGNDARFLLLRSEPLPPGWLGKNWACHQLAQQAHGGILIFTDADVIWKPGAVDATVSALLNMSGDLLTVWPTQITLTWAERLVVPLMSFAVLAYLPVRWAHELPYPSAAAANGQCMIFQRAAYAACGGHAAVRNRVLEDVLLAQRVKASGGQLRMVDGHGLVAARMYRSWLDARNGYAKNIVAGHANSVLLLLLSTAFHLSLFIWPWLWLFGRGGIAWPWWPALLIGLGYAVRAICAATAGQRMVDVLLMPISVLMMTRIALQALWWRWRGGPIWKGRRVIEN
jgi:chlorobactene glucosyltransferase